METQETIVKRSWM